MARPKRRPVTAASLTRPVVIQNRPQAMAQNKSDGNRVSVIV